MQNDGPFEAAAGALSAVVVTGAPGSGKSAILAALSDLLAKAGVEHGAIELEQLQWGHPWLSFTAGLGLLNGVLAEQRRIGRRLFLIAATTETATQLDGLVATLGPGRVIVVALRATAETVAARILRREPAHWSGREALASHARHLAEVIPRLGRVDLVFDTDDSLPLDVARSIQIDLRQASEVGGHLTDP